MMIDDNFRKKFCEMCIKTLEEMEPSEQRDAAIKIYREQLARIEARLKPPPVVVGLKTAELFGKTK